MDNKLPELNEAEKHAMSDGALYIRAIQSLADARDENNRLQQELDAAAKQLTDVNNVLTAHEELWHYTSGSTAEMVRLALQTAKQERDEALEKVERHETTIGCLQRRLDEKVSDIDDAMLDLDKLQGELNDAREMMLNLESQRDEAKDLLKRCALELSWTKRNNQLYLKIAHVIKELLCEEEDGDE